MFFFVFVDTEHAFYHFLRLNCKTLTCFLLCVVEMKSVLILTLAFLACFLLEPVSSSCVFKQTRVALYSLLIKTSLILIRDLINKSVQKSYLVASSIE